MQTSVRSPVLQKCKTRDSIGVDKDQRNGIEAPDPDGGSNQLEFLNERKK